MILAERAEDCCGCGSCMTVCPKQAITMAQRPDGSCYPAIDQALCVDCGLCQKVCAYGPSSGSAAPKAAYAACGKKAELVRDSASGGVFASLASNVLAKGGMVAGAVMDCGENNIRVYHVLSDSVADMKRMQGSKYVQSEAWHCYGALQNALDQGKYVLFSGTPCQVAAVKKLTGDSDNLLTLDFICHGTPPGKLFQDYCKLLEQKYSCRVNSFCFRNKDTGKNFCARLDMCGKGKTRSVYIRSRFLSFYENFLKGSIYRENCYSCPYASLNRVSDLTMGDYWGIEKFHESDFASGEMHRNRTWSCLLVNTEKGESFLAKHGAQLDLHESCPEWIAASNRQLNMPSTRPDDRDRLLELYQTGGYNALEKAFIRSSGGTIRYHLRLLKNIYQNSILRKNNTRHEN